MAIYNTVYQNMSKKAIEKYILEKFVIKKQSAEALC